MLHGSNAMDDSPRPRRAASKWSHRHRPLGLLSSLPAATVAFLLPLLLMSVMMNYCLRADAAEPAPRNCSRDSRRCASDNEMTKHNTVCQPTPPNVFFTQDCEYPEYDFRVLDECDRLPEHPISSSIRLQCANTRDGVALNVSWAITDDSYLYVTGFKVSLFDSGGKHCSFVLPAATMDQRYRTWFLLYDYSEMKPCIKERWFPGVLASLRSIALRSLPIGVEKVDHEAGVYELSPSDQSMVENCALSASKFALDRCQVVDLDYNMSDSWTPRTELTTQRISSADTPMTTTGPVKEEGVNGSDSSYSSTSATNSSSSSTGTPIADTIPTTRELIRESDVREDIVLILAVALACLLTCVVVLAISRVMRKNIKYLKSPVLKELSTSADEEHLSPDFGYPPPSCGHGGPLPPPITPPPIASHR
eukprot:scpid86062/ scgid4342/ 